MLSILLFVLVVALQAADAFLTWRLLRAGGRELNPVMRFLIDRLGLVPGLLAKVVLGVIAGLLIRHQVLLLLATIALYAWVVSHNWRQLFKGGTA